MYIKTHDPDNFILLINTKQLDRICGVVYWESHDRENKFEVQYWKDNKIISYERYENETALIDRMEVIEKVIDE